MSNPLFLTFEGPDGSGKSTQARLLADELSRRGYCAVLTHEPGGTAIGEKVRALALGRDAPESDPLTLTFLVSASRAELVRQVIRPALDAGHIVIADRYADSTLAYQAYGMGVSRGDVEMLTRVATGGLVPDLSLYIRLPEEVSRERLRGRQDGNRLDDETFAFHQRVRAGYDQLIEEEPERWAVIDGNAPAEAVHRAVLAAVAPLLRPEGTTR